MLHVINFEFAVPSSLKFQSFSGFEVRGFFYHVVSSVDETLASSLHAGKALSPFAVTPVMLKRDGGDIVCYDHVSPGLASFSFILFRDDEARVVEDALRQGMSTVKLVDSEFPLTTVRLTQVDPALIDREGLPSFAPDLEGFMSWVEAGGVLLSGFPAGIFTKRIYEHPMTNKWAVGFVGNVNFSFSKKLSNDKMIEAASTLLRFGEIVGVGAGRTSGMGRYRIAAKQAESTEDEQEEGQERKMYL